jgi:hypothetical protein
MNKKKKKKLQNHVRGFQWIIVGVCGFFLSGIMLENHPGDVLRTFMVAMFVVLVCGVLQIFKTEFEENLKDLGSKKKEKEEEVEE